MGKFSEFIKTGLETGTHRLFRCREKGEYILDCLGLF